MTDTLVQPYQRDIALRNITLNLETKLKSITIKKKGQLKKTPKGEKTVPKKNYASKTPAQAMLRLIMSLSAFIQTEG